MLTAADVVGKRVTTIEGLAPEGGLHPVQQAWIDEDVAQCGFCQPGQIMQAAALLESKSSPSDADIDQIVNVPVRHVLPDPQGDQTRRGHDVNPATPALHSCRQPSVPFPATPPSRRPVCCSPRGRDVAWARPRHSSTTG